MAIKIVSNQGDIAQLSADVITRISAQKGLTYRIITENNISPEDIVASRKGDDLFLSSAKNKTSVAIEGFWRICADEGTQGCTVLIDVPASVTPSATGTTAMGIATIDPNASVMSKLTAGDAGSIAPDASIAAHKFGLLDHAYIQKLYANSTETPWLLAKLPWIAAGAAAIGGIALASSSGGSNDTTSSQNTISINNVSLSNGTNGNWVISGTTQPNSSVLITFPDNSSVTTTANGSGSFTLQSSSIAVIGSTATFSASKVSGSTLLATSTTGYSQPTIMVDTGSGVNISTDTYVTSRPTPLLSGKAYPNASVTVYDANDTLIGTTTANSSGKWNLMLPSSYKLKEDISQSFYATASSPTIAVNLTSSSVAVTYDIQAVIPTFTLNAVDTNGAISIDAANIAIEPKASYTIAFADGTTYTVTSDELTGTLANTSFSSGKYQASGPVVITAVDAAGNIAKSFVDYEDKTAPAKPTVERNAKLESQFSSLKELGLYQGAVAVKGNAEPGSTVTINFPSMLKTAWYGLYTVNNEGTIIIEKNDTLVINASGKERVITLYLPDGKSEQITSDIDGKWTLPAKTITPITANAVTGENSLVSYPIYATYEADTQIITSTAIAAIPATDSTDAISIGDWLSTPSPAGLVSGDIKVTATDAEGNISPEAIYKYSDTTAPVVHRVALFDTQLQSQFTNKSLLNNVLVGSTKALSAQFIYEAYCDATISVDNAAPIKLTKHAYASLPDSNNTNGNIGLLSEKETALLTEGQHTLTLKVTDAAGNNTTQTQAFWVGELASGNVGDNDDVIFITNTRAEALASTFANPIDALGGHNVLQITDTLYFTPTTDFDLASKLRNISQIDMHSNGGSVQGLQLSFDTVKSITQAGSNGIQQLLVTGDVLTNYNDQVNVSGSTYAKSDTTTTIDDVAFYTYSSPNFPNIELLIQLGIGVTNNV